MPYISVSRETLRLIAEKIKLIEDSESLGFSNLLLQLTQNESLLSAARGLLIFGIQRAIPGLTEVLAQLQINPAAFEYNQRLLDLDEFYNHLQTKFTFEDTRDLPWSKQELENLTLEIFKNILKEDPKLARLKSIIPSLEKLQDYTKKLPAKYNKLTESRWFGNQDRAETIKFLQLIETCSVDSSIIESDRLERQIRLASLIFVAMHIDAQGWILSSKGGMLNEGSTLYKECLALLNITELSELHLSFRIKLLNQLLDFIINVIEHYTTDRLISRENLQAIKLEIETFISNLKTPANTYLETAKSLVSYTGITSLFGAKKEEPKKLCQKAEEEELFVRWANKLLQLPHAIFPEEDKCYLRTVLGLELGQEMKMDGRTTPGVRLHC